MLDQRMLHNINVFHYLISSLGGILFIFCSPIIMHSIVLQKGRIFITLHLFSHNPILITHLEVWTLMKISGNEFHHLILVQIDFAGVAFIIIVITVIYTVFAVYCIGHSQNLLSQKILLQLLSFLIYL